MMSVHASMLELPVTESATRLRPPAPKGLRNRNSYLRDGARILWLIDTAEVKGNSASDPLLRHAGRGDHLGRNSAS